MDNDLDENDANVLTIIAASLEQNENFHARIKRNIITNSIRNFIIGSALLALALSRSGSDGRRQAKACLYITAGINICVSIPYSLTVYAL